MIPRSALHDLLAEAVDEVLGVGSIDALERDLPEQDVPASVEWLRRQLS